MKDIRIPGVVWAALLVAIVALVHEYQVQLSIDPFYIDLLVVVAVAVLKSLSLGTGQLNQALDVIEEIRRQNGATRQRGTLVAPAGIDEPQMASLVEQAPERPNNFVRFLLG